MATVDIHYLKAALNCAQRKGISTQGLLQEIGINQAQLKQSEGQIQGDQYIRLIQLVWAKLEDEFMGCTETPCKQGVFAFMARHVMHYKSLEAVLEQGILFYNLFTSDIQMKLVRQQKIVSIEIEFTRPELDPDHFYQEFWMVIWHRFASWIINKKITLTQVYFPYAKPEHHHPLKRLFHCQHYFNRPVMKFSFSSEFLALPPARTQRDLSQFLRHSPADLITIPGEEQSYRGRIRLLLLNQDSEVLQCPSFEQLAESFNMSAQTLRRRLKRENTSYPVIKDEIRKDLAIEKLISQRRSISEVAFSLGYTEPRSLSRAFKGWTGLTPSDYIRQKAQKSPVR